MRLFLASLAVAWLGPLPAARPQAPVPTQSVPGQPPSAEITLALREYRDALMALKTLERSVDEAAQRRLEALVQRPQATVAVALPTTAAFAVPTTAALSFAPVAALAGLGAAGPAAGAAQGAMTL